jgi:hypothetical protein
VYCVGLHVLLGMAVDLGNDILKKVLFVVRWHVCIQPYPSSQMHYNTGSVLIT